LVEPGVEELLELKNYQPLLRKSA